MATAVGHRSLMQPTQRQCGAQRELGSFAAEEIVEIGCDLPAEMLAQTAPLAPSVLFTMSHGLGAPKGGWRSPEEQRELQGSMSFGRGVKLTAADVSRGGFLPGGVWLYFACFSAGTPARSAFYPWLRRLRELGQHSQRLERVLAALPKEAGLFRSSRSRSSMNRPIAARFVSSSRCGKSPDRAATTFRISSSVRSR